MKSTEDASLTASSIFLRALAGSSSRPSQTSQVSPVVTGTGLARLTRWMMEISSSTDFSAAQHGLVADHDGAHVAVAASERDRGLDFPLIASFVFVDPDTERHAQTEFGGDPGNQFHTGGRGIGSDGTGVGTQLPQVGTNLIGGRPVAIVGMLRARVRRIGDAGELPVKIRARILPVEKAPQASMHARDERDDCNNEFSWKFKPNGQLAGPEPIPQGHPRPCVTVA